MPRSLVTGLYPGQLPAPTASEPGWIAVSSSNVREVRYVRPEVYAVREAVLQVRFKNGAAYTYWGVSEGEWDDLFSTGSKGSWVWEALRGRRKGAALKPYRQGLHYG